MPVCDSFLVLPPAESEYAAIFGVNCMRPKDEAQEVVYYGSQSGETGSTLECTNTCISDIGRGYAIIVTKPAWMWGAEAGANECGVTIACVATLTKDACTPCTCSDDGTLLPQDLVRLGLERGQTAKTALDSVCQLVGEYGLGGKASESTLNCYACIVFADRTVAWTLDIAGRQWAARRLTEGYCCLSDMLQKKESYSKTSENFQDCWSSTLAQTFCPHPSNNGGTAWRQYCLQNCDVTSGVSSVISMFDHLRSASATRIQSDQLGTITCFVSVLQKSESLAVHWFTATPDPAISIFKPFVFRDNSKPCLLTLSSCAARDTAGSDLRTELHREHCSASGRLRDNDGRLRDILRQLESECVQEMKNLVHSASVTASEDSIDDIGNIFTGICQAEIKFYRKASM